MSLHTFRCCKCCDDMAKTDHVEHGGTIEKDGHDGPCSTCQEGSGSYERGYAAGAAAVVERVADDLLTDWGTELGRDNVAGVHDWLLRYAALTEARDV